MPCQNSYEFEQKVLANFAHISINLYPVILPNLYLQDTSCYIDLYLSIQDTSCYIDLYLYDPTQHRQNRIHPV